MTAKLTEAPLFVFTEEGDVPHAELGRLFGFISGPFDCVLTNPKEIVKGYQGPVAYGLDEFGSTWFCPCSSEELRDIGFHWELFVGGRVLFPPSVQGLGELR